ncbi:MAG: hypothetical protein GWP39_03830 [Planctomycetia bacterium]|nr:hypothetical protein [Planctomycetia bacterium]
MILQLFSKLGKLIEEGTYPVMIPLIVTCFIISYLTVERFRYLYEPRTLFKFFPPIARKLASDKSTFEKSKIKFLSADTKVTRDNLRIACLNYSTPLSSFLLRCIEGMGAQGGKVRKLEIEHAEYTERLAIENSIPVLSTFARTAPLMGLMGTVTGMIATFSAMMLSSGSDPKALSSGISIALLATNVGLVVSLPGIVALSVLSRRGRVLQEQIRNTALVLRNSGEDVTSQTGWDKADEK